MMAINGVLFFVRLWEMDTLAREATLSKICCLPCQEGSTLNKNSLRLERKFFPFKVDTFSEEAQCIGKQTGSHRSCLSLLK